MILGVGIDMVEINRFYKWQNFSTDQLMRIFTYDEIEYARCIPSRLATRFAAREAALKAFSAIAIRPLALLSIAKMVSVQRNGDGRSYLVVDWQMLQPYVVVPVSNLKVHVSLTDTLMIASAVVIVEQL